MAQQLLSHLAVVGLVLGLAAAPAAAAEAPVSRSQTLSAGHARIEGMIGRLTVIPEDRADVAIAWRGSRRWVEAVQTSVDGGTAVFDARRAASVGGGSVQAGNVTTVAIGGGTATTIIGGRQVAAGGEEVEPEAELRVPRSGRLVIDGGGGNCRIGATSGDVRLRLVSGDCSLARLGQGGTITIDGAGSVGIGDGAGDLALAIAGSGDIKVAKGSFGRLGARIDGNGSIAVEGSARTGDLAINGAGDIRVGSILEKPRRSLNGAGDISVGNWP